jgi:hypothetical protein
LGEADAEEVRMKGCFVVSLWIVGLIIAFMLMGAYALPVLGVILLLGLLGAL